MALDKRSCTYFIKPPIFPHLLPEGSVNHLEKEKTGLKATAEAFKTLQAEAAFTVEKLEEAARNNQKLRQENKTLAVRK